ncbi:MAG: hypothetical protein RI885_527 [Actinomycetota bacterium]
MTGRALELDGCVELAVLERGSFVESRHVGVAAVVAPDGSPIRTLGDADAHVFGRSSLKLFQAVASLRSGADLRGAELVLASASHAGTARHVEVVRGILAAAGLDDGALQCPHAWPFDRHAMFDAHDSGLGGRRIAMNCSGKHAAFLAACVANGWDTAGYLEPSHPLQQSVIGVVQEFTGEVIGPVGVDGCGAPVVATTVTGLARGVGRVSGAARNGGDPAAGLLTAAILEHPWAIDGPGRANTVVIEKIGLVAKLGAEGVMVMGTLDGTAVALKVLDGSLRAATLVALELLAGVGAIERAAADAVIAETTESVTGGGRVVGALHASPLVRAT